MQNRIKLKIKTKLVLKGGCLQYKARLKNRNKSNIMKVKVDNYLR